MRGQDELGKVIFIDEAFRRALHPHLERFRMSHGRCVAQMHQERPLYVEVICLDCHAARVVPIDMKTGLPTTFQPWSSGMRRLIEATGITDCHRCADKPQRPPSKLHPLVQLDEQLQQLDQENPERK